MIEFREASVVVPSAGTESDTTILQPTTLSLTEQRISVIGGNGSGKSTLARLINGLIEPSTGSVKIVPHASGSGSRADENSAESAPAAPATGERVNNDPAAAGARDLPLLDTRDDGPAVRRAVGFVFASPDAQLIMPTAAEDIALSLRRTHPRKADRIAAAHEALQRFDLGELAERSVHTLSGGQKQLLAIASVLATDPAILVADEPTTLLDLRNARAVGDLLMSLPQQVVIVTHDLDLAARADRTLVVEDARVVFDGAPGEAIAFYRDRAVRA